MTKSKRWNGISCRLTDHIEATNAQSRIRRELWSSHTATVDFIEAEIEAAESALRERIIARCMVEMRDESLLDAYDEGYNDGLTKAIEIVKGGEDGNKAKN